MKNNSTISQFLVGALGGAVATYLLLNFGSPELFSRKFAQTQNMSAIHEEKPFVASDAHEGSVVDTVHEAQGAVVSIVITKDVPIIERYYEDAPGGFSPFGGLFNSPFQLRVPQLRQNGTEKQEVGGGSGFLVSSDGLIVTNKHVVEDEEAEYTVFTNDGTKYNAKVIGRDPSNDIAVIKIEGDNFPFLSFGSSESVQVGQTAVAIGNTLGEFRNTVSVGVISGLSRSIVAGDQSGKAEQLDEVIQTDAAINPGNSGGPLLNLRGEVIGVNVAVAQGSQSVGFALPADVVKSVVESVQSTGKISRPFLGVRYTIITPAIKESNKLTVDSGALVVRGETANDLAVTPGSPADKAGIVEGDIILEADGVAINEDTSLATIIRKKQVGDTIKLKILHKGNEQTITVTLQEVPS